MALREKLEARRASAKDRFPPEDLAVMRRATEELRHSGILQRALKAGDATPEWKLPSPRAGVVHSRELLEDGPLVLTFFRGVWWAYCKLELAALEESFSELQSLNATLVALSPQLPEHCAAMTAKLHLSFDVLSDAHNEIARRFGIVFRLPDDLAQIYVKFNMDVAKFNGDLSWELPMPARYVIDQRNVIRSAEVNYDYTHRPEPAETLAVLRNLHSADARSH